MKLTRRDFLLLIIIIYFTFIGGTFYSQFNLTLRITNQIIVTGLLSVWLWRKIRTGEGLPRTYLDLPLLFYLLVNLISAVAGLSPRFSLEMLWFTLIHILAFYVLVDLMRRGWTPKIAWAFYMASAVVCLVGMAEFLAWYVGTPLFARFALGWLEIGGWQDPIPPYIYRLAITLNGSTPLAAYLALLTPPAFGLILSLPPRNQNRQALQIWLVLAFIVQILTFSRAGILALGVSLPITFVSIGWLKGWRWTNLKAVWRRLSVGIRLTIITAGVIVSGVVGLWFWRSFANRTGSTNFRFTLWETAIRIFQEHWLTGAGPANFGRALLYFNDPLLPRRQITTAHSIYFNTAAELGLLGLLVGLGLFLAVGWSVWQHWRQSQSETHQIRLIACGAALLGLAAQTLVDTYMATPNMLVMLAVIAYVVAPLSPGQPTLTPHRRYPAYAALFALFMYAGALFWLSRADFYFSRSLRYEQAGQLEEAVAQAMIAHQLDPYLSHRLFRLAFLEAKMADQTGDPALAEAAINHYKAALRQEPILGINSANLAGVLWPQGHRAEAIEMMRRTVEVEPHPLYFINLGYFYEQEERWAEAGQAYGSALRRSPALAASDFWQASATRSQQWPHFVEAALSEMRANPAAQNNLRVNLALAQQKFDAIEVLIDPVSSSSYETFNDDLIALYLHQNQIDKAEALLKQSPQTAQDYFLQGRVQLDAKAYALAEKSLKTAAFLSHPRAYYYLGQLYERQAQLQAAEMAYQRGFAPRYLPENIPAAIYDRFGASDLVPQLLRVGAGARQAEAWLALADLYEAQGRFEKAQRVYRLLLAEDPFLEIARKRLEQLN